jgi:transposase
MPKINYPEVIKESQKQLLKLEKRHRYTHLFHRVKMLRLLKSGECSNLGEVAQALGYSWRQCQRWFALYRRKGLDELLVSRVDERGPKELVTEEAFAELEEAMKQGEIATIAQAHRFLLERGIGYGHPESVGGLLRRRKVKLKTGRPRHEKADEREQHAFKKVRRQGEATTGRPASRREAG